MAKKIEISSLFTAIEPLIPWLCADDNSILPADIAAATRISAQYLAQIAPGKSVEVRIPPYSAVQCIAGPKHTRGVPPNIIELDARTWLKLVIGKTTYDQAYRSITASGLRCDQIAQYLPMIELA